jgi:peptidoglycan/xylan/chitin deacetylase (PgdA/CDA1 family)
MRRKYIIIIAIFLGLAIFSCNRSHQHPRTENPGAAATAIEVKDSVVVKKSENTSAQQYAKPEVPVLCYHRISDGPKSEYRVSAATFTSHMKALSDSGYHSISPAQLYDYLVYNKTLPEKPVMISFDDSREEHSSIAAPIMEKYGFRGVFFIMTITYNKKNYMTTDQIAQLAKAGHTIGLHSWDHTMVIKYKESADWQKQVVEPKKKLEGIVGKAVEYWAYPNGVYNHDGAEELSKYFKLSFTLYSKRDSDVPLQTVRRMIVPECTSSGLLKSMRQTFRQIKK